MQILKGDRDSQLLKDEGTHLRKINPQDSMAEKTTLRSMRPFNGEESWRIPWPVDTMGVSAGSHAAPSQKKTGEKGEVKDHVPRTCRGQRSYTKDLPEGRTLTVMMMMKQKVIR